MRGRYVLTSTCIFTGCLNLTQSLRGMLEDRERATFVDEDGECWEGFVNTSHGYVEGFHPYLQKRSLQPNDIIWLTLQEDGSVALEAAVARPPQQVSKHRLPRVEAEKAIVEEEQVPVKARMQSSESRSVRITPYPRAVMYPQEGADPPMPAYVRELAQLGFSSSHDGAFHVFRAHLGRRSLGVVMGRYGDTEASALAQQRESNELPFAAWVVSESEREAARSEMLRHRLAMVTPEGLTALSRLSRMFPVGAIDVERLLKGGKLDLAAVDTLGKEVASWVGERAEFSTVLIALSEIHPQQVFLLEDLAENLVEAGIGREVLVRILDVLSGPPFLLLRKLSPGEYTLRESVDESLKKIVTYAEALRDRLSVPA